MQLISSFSKTKFIKTKWLLVVIFCSSISTLAFASDEKQVQQSEKTYTNADMPITFDHAKAIYEQNEQKSEYKDYLEEFNTWDENFNNALRGKKHCTSTAKTEFENISMLLIISRKGVITQVMPYDKSDHADCLQNAYKGLKVKPPPFTPFVMEFITSGSTIKIVH